METNKEKYIEELKELAEILKDIKQNIWMLRSTIESKIDKVLMEDSVSKIKRNLLNRETGVIHRIDKLVYIKGTYYYSTLCMHSDSSLPRVGFILYKDTDEPVTCKNCLKKMRRFSPN